VRNFFGERIYLNGGAARTGEFDYPEPKRHRPNQRNSVADAG